MEINEYKMPKTAGLTVKRLHKTYGKRKIQVYDGKKFLGEITECWGWICISSKENHNILRQVAMENLWWLLHNDHINEDYTEYEAWCEKINYWDKGRMMMVPIDEEPTSNFLSFDEKLVALNSINNK